jgi:RHS repeat-associated protein
VVTSNVNSVANRFGYGGKELQEDLGLEMYDFGARLQDPSLGRWFVVDALAGYPTQIDKSPYAYAWNNPIFYTDPDGNCPICPGLVNFFLNAIPGAVQDNNSADAHVVGVVINNGLNGLVSAASNPGATGEALLNLASPTSGGSGVIARSQAGQGIANDADAVLNGNGLERGEVIGRAAFDASVGVVTAEAGGVVSNVVGRVVKSLDGVANPVPSRMARVLPADIDAQTLGRAGDTDVFVTAADDIQGMNSSQIADRLTIPESSSGFQVIEFDTPSTGVSTPVFRGNPGFVGRGKTAGGAREFSVPNVPISQLRNVQFHYPH